jgi:pimeloyl-ACP methyl ester carboxylesterase
MTEPQAEKTGTIDVEGGKVWYRENGGRHHGAVPVLCIHGGPGLSYEYMLPLADLADERRVIFYDQLDAGKADRPGDPAN